MSWLVKNIKYYTGLDGDKGKEAQQQQQGEQQLSRDEIRARRLAKLAGGGAAAGAAAGGATGARGGQNTPEPREKQPELSRDRKEDTATKCGPTGAAEAVAEPAASNAVQAEEKAAEAAQNKLLGEEMEKRTQQEPKEQQRPQQQAEQEGAEATTAAPTAPAAPAAPATIATTPPPTTPTTAANASPAEPHHRPPSRLLAHQSPQPKTAQTGRTQPTSSPAKKPTASKPSPAAVSKPTATTPAELLLKWQTVVCRSVIKASAATSSKQATRMQEFLKESLDQCFWAAGAKELADALCVRAAGATYRNESVFSELMACYSRISRTRDELSRQARRDAASFKVVFPGATFPFGADAAADWATVETALVNLATCCASLLAQSLCNSELFELPSQQRSMIGFMQLLKADPRYSRSLPPEVLSLMVECLGAKKTELVFARVLDSVNAILENTGLERPTLEMEVARASEACLVLIKLCKSKELARALVMHPQFLPPAALADKAAPRSLQDAGLLGPLLSVVIREEDPMFEGFTTSHSVSLAMNSAKQVISQYHETLSALFKALIKDKVSREKLLSWVAALLKANKDRRKMAYDHNAVASDGFLINITVALLGLCKPITKSDSAAKLDSVDLSYFTSPLARVDYEGDARVTATPADLEQALKSGSLPETYNFSTEIFALTLEALRLGPMAALRFEESTLLRRLGQAQRQLQSMEASQNPMAQHSIPLVRHQVDKMFAKVFSVRCMLFEEQTALTFTKFYSWACAWFTHAAELGTVGAVPESIMEDVVTYFAAFARFQDTARMYATLEDHMPGVLTLAVKGMAGPLALKNPHTRGKFATMLKLHIPKATNFGSGASDSHVYNTHPVLSTGLIPALLELYVTIEFGPGQYYEKWTVRQTITQILEFLWEIPAQRALFVRTSRSGDFPRFINMVANDIIGLLDQSIEALTEIKEMQTLMASPVWQTMSLAARQEKERHLEITERETYAISLAHSTVHLLYLVTQEVTEPFVEDEYVMRFAQIVDDYIVKLAGKEVNNLNVQDRDKYHFKPRVLLQEMLGVFVQLSVSEKFLTAVASDDRSFDAEVFTKAARKARKYEMLRPSEVARFEEALRIVLDLREKLEEENALFEDFPDEFSDPLMATLMRDPVTLPSGVDIDRATIKRHLLNGDYDPFNRSPLTMDQVVPNVELKKKVDAWVAEMTLKARLAAPAAACSASEGKCADEDMDDLYT